MKKKSAPAKSAKAINIRPHSSILVDGPERAAARAMLYPVGFTEEDFARSHPAGSLGRRLLLHVQDVMRTGPDIPTVRADTSRSDGLIEMTRKGLGMTAVVDVAGRVQGVFTDGDLRRALDRSADLHTTRMDQVMSRHAKTVRPTTLAAEAVHLMETHRITALVVVDADEQIVSALNVHDLLRAGVV